jgi:hypothetical protein
MASFAAVQRYRMRCLTKVHGLLAERLEELFGTEPEFVCERGPIVATHVRPRSLWAGSLSAAAFR